MALHQYIFHDLQTIPESILLDSQMIRIIEEYMLLITYPIYDDLALLGYLI